MAIKDQIERIIQARQERGKSLRQRKAALQELKAKLKSASSNLVLRSGDIKDERLREQYGPVFAAVDTRRVERAADQAMRRMDEGIQRKIAQIALFSRDLMTGKNTMTMLYNEGAYGDDPFPDEILWKFAAAGTDPRENYPGVLTR